MKLSRLKNRLFKNFLAGLAIGVGILTSALLAVTVSGTFNTFASGNLLKSSDINTNFATLKTAIESIPNWTKNGTTAVYNDGNITVNGRISSANLGLYCGITASSFTGNIGGFTSAKALCATACGNSNAHMCTAHEIIMSLQLGVSLPGSGNYWITSPTTSANTDLLDCNSWTSSSASPNQGSTISIGSPSQLFIAYCNTSHQIACCL